MLFNWLTTGRKDLITLATITDYLCLSDRHETYPRVSELLTIRRQRCLRMSGFSRVSHSSRLPRRDECAKAWPILEVVGSWLAFYGHNIEVARALCAPRTRSSRQRESEFIPHREKQEKTNSNAFQIFNFNVYVII